MIPIGWQFPTKKLFRGRRNRRNIWFVPAAFRLFHGTENSRNSVPNNSPEEKNARNSVPWNKKLEANSRNSVQTIPQKRTQLGTPFRGTKIKANFRNFVTKHFAKKTRS
jgi:hypothetical protein